MDQAPYAFHIMGRSRLAVKSHWVDNNYTFFLTLSKEEIFFTLFTELLYKEIFTSHLPVLQTHSSMSPEQDEHLPPTL